MFDKDDDKKFLKISEVAKLSGVLPSTVRYYTDMGLISAAAETPGGHRLYDRDTIMARINRIQFMNKQGHTIDEIRKDLMTSVSAKKILVIDDEVELCELVIGVVKTHFQECEIKAVNDGFTAGRILNEYLPDLIILDLMLPGINGFDVCKQIRTNNDHTKHIKILAITGYDSEENKMKILSCGADDFLAKPMDIKVLKEKMQKLLGQ